MHERSKSEVARLVLDGRWKLKHLKSFRTQFGDPALFEVLYEPFDAASDLEYTFYEQQMMGRLLLELQPECPVAVKEVITRSLNQWNRSVEELPFYLERCFGRQNVLEAVGEIEQNSHLNESARDELKTCRYWLRD